MKWSVVVVLLVLLSGPLRAQHRYWTADYDSLRRVLHRQATDTGRVRTLTHLLDVTELTEAARRPQALPLLDELLRLNQRTHQLPSEAAYRELRAGLQLWVAGRNYAQAMSALQQAIELFDQAHHPVPRLLIDLAPLYNQMQDSEQRFAYFRRKLTQYRVQGARENQAACYLVLGGSYRHRADYNQAISHYLHAADLFSTFDRNLWSSELMVAGTNYAEWGNTRKALEYLGKAIRLTERYRIRGLQRFFAQHAVGQLYLQEHRLPAAQYYADRALNAAQEDSLSRDQFTAYALVLKSLVLLEQHQPAAALPLLRRAQHLADSLQLSISARPGELALETAWARYYTARHDTERAAAYWHKAYRKAVEAHLQVLQAKYLRQLIEFEQGRGATGPALAYTRTYLHLLDTLKTAQGNNLLAQYEGERVEQAQNAQIARLRHQQEVQRLRLHQRNQLLALALVALLLISVLGALVYRQLQVNRRTLAKLRQTQNQLVQSEKWAFVGEVSAGIAHELQNPLNFMKKFAEVSTALVDNMHSPQRQPGLEQEILLGLRQNLQEISQHGMRASAIIKDMLEHSRAGTGQRVATDLNALLLEYLHLARQSPELRDAAQAVSVETVLAPDLPPVPLVPQDMGRVLLNLFTNAFYAVRQRQQTGEAGYEPQVRIESVLLPEAVQVRVHDNGVGVPDALREKIFQAFFTTKPVGEGTGLGLSLSHDIVKGHGGTLQVDSQPGHGAEFIVNLPRKEGRP